MEITSINLSTIVNFDENKTHKKNIQRKAKQEIKKQK